MEGDEGDMMFGVVAYGEYAEHHKEDFYDEEEAELYFDYEKKNKCICNEGIHDGKRIDCGCKICH